MEENEDVTTEGKLLKKRKREGKFQVVIQFIYKSFTIIRYVYVCACACVRVHEYVSFITRRRILINYRATINATIIFQKRSS